MSAPRAVLFRCQRAGLVLIAALTLVACSDGSPSRVEGEVSGEFAESIRDLLEDHDPPGEREVGRTLDPAGTILGVTLGSPVSILIDAWGKPSSISIDADTHGKLDCVLRYRHGPWFQYESGRLTAVSVAELPGACLTSGVGLGDKSAFVRKLMGNPSKVERRTVPPAGVVEDWVYLMTGGIETRILIMKGVVQRIKISTK